jgi:hypothetical protein
LNVIQIFGITDRKPAQSNLVSQLKNHLSLAPLGAGDLIDRTVRLYRRHFATLVGMSVPPVVLSAAGAVVWTLGVRGVSVTDSSSLLVAYVLLAGAGALLQLVGTLFHVIVMGGAARSLVAHLLWGERVTVRAIYRSVRERFWRLLGAGVVLSVWLGFAFACAAFVWFFIVGMLGVGIAVFSLNLMMSEWVLGVVGLLIGVLAGIVALCVFFYFGGLLAYVLQAMMVEGCGVFAAVNRSISLARGHLRRLAAMFSFTVFASFSAWLLLIIPLLSIGYAQGYSLSPWSLEDAPVWYQIGYHVLWQASSVLLAPVWMLGLSVLYIDERVRQEGYDIELAAARVFGNMPELASGQSAPITFALAANRTQSNQAEDARTPAARPWKSPGAVLFAEHDSAITEAVTSESVTSQSITSEAVTHTSATAPDSDAFVVESDRR